MYSWLRPAQPAPRSTADACSEVQGALPIDSGLAAAQSSPAGHLTMRSFQPGSWSSRSFEGAPDPVAIRCVALEEADGGILEDQDR